MREKNGQKREENEKKKKKKRLNIRGFILELL